MHKMELRDVFPELRPLNRCWKKHSWRHFDNIEAQAANLNDLDDSFINATSGDPNHHVREGK